MTIKDLKQFIEKELTQRKKFKLRSPILEAYNEGVTHCLKKIQNMINQKKEEE